MASQFLIGDLEPARVTNTFYFSKFVLLFVENVTQELTKMASFVRAVDAKFNDKKNQGPHDQ